MPPVYDRRALPIDRDPMRSIFGEPAKLPKLDAGVIWAEWLRGLKELTGLDLSSPEALVLSLGDIIGGALDPENLVPILSQVFGYIGPPLAGMNQLAQWVGQHVFGLIDPRRLAQIPLGSIVRDSPNLLPNGSFADAIAVDDPTAAWVRDTATYRSAPASVRTAADGTIRELLSVDAIPVQAGQKLDVSGYVRWASLTAGADAIALGLMTYGDDGEQRVLIDTVAAPAGTQLTWQKLDGQYEVPEGVTTVRVRLIVTQDATAGNVWFDDLAASLGSNKPQIDWIDGLRDELAAAFASAAAAAQAFGDFLNTQWQQMLNGVKGGVGGVIEDLIDKLQHLTPSGLFDASRLTNMLNIPPIDLENVLDLSDELADLGDGIADVFDDIRSTWGHWWNALTGQGQQSVTAADTAEQIAALAAAQVANSIAIAELRAHQDGSTNSGMQGLDDFEREVENGLGGLMYWAQSTDYGSQGYVRIRNGQVEWVDQGAGATQYRFRCTRSDIAHTETDYQRATLVVGTISAESHFPTDSTTQHSRIYVRMSDDETRYVFVEFGGAELAQFGYRNGGSEVLVGSAFSCSRGSVGATFTLEAGTAGGSRIFRFLVNGKPVSGGLWNDSTGVTAMGEDCRGWGFGMAAGSRLGAGQTTPNSYGAVTIADNTPTPTRGVGMRVYRGSTSGAGQSSPSSTVPFTTNTLDTIDRITPGLDWNPATQTLTIGIEGWYTFPMRIQSGSDQPVGREWRTAVFKNGVLAAYGDTYGMHTSVGGNGGGGDPRNRTLGGGGMELYCDVGDEIQPACDVTLADPVPIVNPNGNPGNLVGDAGGTRTWFCAILLNRSTA
ncbi:minor tail protein [Mycobacterium phage Shaobing]|nr:minor tail protein [Mycobacterium phage Shaobing]